MIKTLRKLPTLLGIVLASALTQQAEAVLISGTISFNGAAVFDTADIGTATQVVDFPGTTVLARNGDFSGVAIGAAVIMAEPWVFNPPTPTPSLWSVGGFTFNLLSSAIVSQDSTFLNVSGTGTITAIGFDPTPGVFNFTATEPDVDGVFSFAASSGSTSTRTVPEGSAAIALLGIAMMALEGFRRKFGAA